MNNPKNIKLTLSRLAIYIVGFYSCAFITLSFSLYCAVASSINTQGYLTLKQATIYAVKKATNIENLLINLDSEKNLSYKITCDHLDEQYSNRFSKDNIRMENLLNSNNYIHYSIKSIFNDRECITYTATPKLYTDALSAQLFKQFLFYTSVITITSLIIIIFFIRWWKTKVANVSSFIRNKDSDLKGFKSYESEDFSDIISSVQTLKNELSARNNNALAFSHHVAHELRQPLQGVLCQLESTLFDKKSSDELVNLSKYLLHEISRLKTIVDSLFFLFEKSDSILNGKLENVDLCELTSDVVCFYSPLAEDNNLTLNYECNGIIHANRELYSRLLYNLVSNAIKFSAKGGAILISFMAETDCVHIEVKDTGCGIEENDLPMLFEPFFRSDRIKSTTSGLGLGLALVKKIVDTLSGTLRVESTYGVGTTFFIRIPLLR